MHHFYFDASALVKRYTQETREALEVWIFDTLEKSLIAESHSCKLDVYIS